MCICTLASKKLKSDCLWSLTGLIYVLKSPFFWRKTENNQRLKNSGDILCYALHKSHWKKHCIVFAVPGAMRNFSNKERITVAITENI